MSEFFELIKPWQALIAGLIAFSGAILTVWAIRKQINNENEQHKELRRRKYLAARSVLPTDLSEICTYTQECAQIIGKALHYFDEHESPPDDLYVPKLSEAVPRNLQRLIEQLDSSDAEEVADLLSCYQVQQARLQGSIEDWRNPPIHPVVKVWSRDNIEHPLIETIRLRVLAENMFEFARRDQNHIPPMENLTTEDVYRALRMMIGPGFPISDKDHELVRNMCLFLVPREHENG